MREVKLGKHNLKIYDSIDELPVVRHHKFSKMMLIDAHIGSELPEFDVHAERIARYITSDQKDKAVAELANLRQNIYFIQTEISPKHLAFATLVHTLDGEEITDLSDESLKTIVDKLSDVPVGEMDKLLGESKKKLETELQTYYPELFENASVKDYYDKLRKRTLLLINKIIKGGLTEEEERELEHVTCELVLFSDPQPFSGPESLEIQQDKQFENACLLIAQHTSTDAKKFTVLEYYNAILYLREQTKGSKKGHKRKGA